MSLHPKTPVPFEKDFNQYTGSLPTITVTGRIWLGLRMSSCAVQNVVSLALVALAALAPWGFPGSLPLV